MLRAVHQLSNGAGLGVCSAVAAELHLRFTFPTTAPFRKCPHGGHAPACKRSPAPAWVLAYARMTWCGPRA